MTQREFYTIISNSNLADDVKAFAVEGIAKLDKKNNSRSSKPSKVAIANQPIKKGIAEMLTGTPMLASEIATNMEISPQKATALCRQLVEEGLISVTTVKVPKKGNLKGYFLVAE